MAGKGVMERPSSASSTGPVIGIDLGTTYSVVAVCRKGRVEILANDSGSRTTPSIVGFLDGESFVGDAAKDLPIESQVFDAKRLIGRPWAEVSSAANQHWPFILVEDRGLAKIRVTVNGKKEDFAPEEISSMVLLNLKELAEELLREKVTKAVITVPAYFNERQRQATKTAARIAGLEVTGMINEPTAAALAYGLDKKLGAKTGKKTVFIYDLGGGTFDVSVMTIEGNKFNVLASGGDTQLGGQDFDNILIDHFVQDILVKHQVKLDQSSLQELRKVCELVKRKLSSLTEVPVAVFFPRHKLGYKSSLSRARFEDLCSDLLKTTIQISGQVLNDSEVGLDAIDDVVLVGGSTRIPKVRALLSEFFGGKQLRRSINPDEAVAYGAAVHASVLNGDKLFDKLVKLKDVTALSLGIQILGGGFSIVVPRNSPIPCEKTEKYCTVSANQTNVSFEVYQGERPLVKDNHYLKKFDLTVPPKPAGQVKMDCTFNLDADGLLTVTSVECSTGERQQVTISEDEIRMSDEDVKTMMENAARFRKLDLDEKERIEHDLRRQFVF